MSSIDVRKVLQSLSDKSNADGEAIQALLDKFIADIEVIVAPYAESDVSLGGMAPYKELYHNVKNSNENIRMRLGMNTRPMPIAPMPPATA
jgi:hypothetical protein